MTIHKDDGEFSVECNTCGSLHPEEFETFGAALAFVRQGPWQPRTDDGGVTWTHLCSDCMATSESPLERAKRLFS